MVRWFLFLILIGGVAFEVQAADRLRIGILAPLSGEFAPMGKRAVDGMMLAFDELPKDKVEVVVEDSGSSGAVSAVKAAAKLVDVDKVAAIVGPFGPDQTIAVAPVALKKNVPLFAYSLCAPELAALTNVVCGYPSTAKQLGSLPSVAAQLNIKTIALIVDDSVFGSNTADTLRALEQQNAFKLVFVDSTSAGETDFRSLVAKVMQAKPDAVFVSILSPSGAFSILKQVREAGFGGERFAYIDTDPKYLKEFGASIEGVMLPGNLANRFSAAFTESYRKKFSGEPDWYAALGYDLLKVVAETASAKDWKTDGLLQNVLDHNYPSPAIPNFDLLPDRTISLPLEVLVVKDGNFASFAETKGLKNP